MGFVMVGGIISIGFTIYHVSFLDSAWSGGV